ncbi:hypothetical protein QZH41_020000 [Actinostola sp. cb2023]|nr:hypothetical protein QZH41_020000 [Actinostola sp. cb2023]
MGDEILVRKLNKERRWSVIMATFFSALGPVTFGYCMGYSSAATTQLQMGPGKNINSTQLLLDEDQITWFGSLLNIGAMLGGPLQGFLVDLLGRKVALIMSSIPFCSGFFLIGFGNTPTMLISGRFLSGLGVGMASMNVPWNLSFSYPEPARHFGLSLALGIPEILANFIG